MALMYAVLCRLSTHLVSDTLASGGQRHLQRLCLARCTAAKVSTYYNMHIV